MKVLIADDHAIVREGLKQIIYRMDAVSLAEEATEGHEALAKIEKNSHDLVILDISMPGMSGMDILKLMKDRKETAPILMLSMHSQEQYAIRALRLGASGYLCKDSVYEELESAIKKIAAGGRYISHALAEKVIFDKIDDLNQLPHEKLSEREFQIMCLLAAGNSVKEIAAKLFLSDKTVSTHRARLLEKMGISKNAELTRYALNNNLIE